MYYSRFNYRITHYKSHSADFLRYLEIHRFPSPEFDTEQVDSLTQSEILLLVRPLGYSLNEKQLLSLTLSLLKTQNACERVYEVVSYLLVEEVGRDYPSQAIDALTVAKGQTTSADLIQLYSNAINQISIRVNALKELPMLKELQSPRNIQRQFAKARAEQMRRAMDSTKNKSPLASLFTDVHIKAGNGVFAYQNGGYTDTTQMKSSAHSYALPMRNTSDTVGHEISHLRLRNIKRDAP